MRYYLAFNFNRKSINHLLLFMFWAARNLYGIDQVKVDFITVFKNMCLSNVRKVCLNYMVCSMWVQCCYFWVMGCFGQRSSVVKRVSVFIIYWNQWYTSNAIWCSRRGFIFLSSGATFFANNCEYNISFTNENDEYINSL